MEASASPLACSGLTVHMGPLRSKRNVADKLPKRPAYVRGAIVEMRAGEYDESPIDFSRRTLR